MKHDLDPCTGNCRRCYARREEIDDNFAPECAEYDGPDAQALYAINDRRRRLVGEAACLERFIASGEDAIVLRSRELRELRGRIAELDATIVRLKGSTP